jgi:hypothetical protein
MPETVSLGYIMAKRPVGEPRLQPSKTKTPVDKLFEIALAQRILLVWLR